MTAQASGAATSEAVPGLGGLLPLGEREDLGGADREDQRRAGPVLEAAVAYLELPLAVPLACPGLRQPGEQGLVGDLDGVALGYHVEPLIPPGAAGQQQHVRVAAQVDGLLLALAGAEVEG